MRLVPILLTTLSMASLNACYNFDGRAFFGELLLTAVTASVIQLQLQGTVTAADDGLPIAGATVKVVATVASESWLLRLLTSQGATPFLS
jgi:hypothetical protein